MKVGEFEGRPVVGGVLTTPQRAIASSITCMRIYENWISSLQRSSTSLSQRARSLCWAFLRASRCLSRIRDGERSWRCMSCRRVWRVRGSLLVGRVMWWERGSSGKPWSVIHLACTPSSLTHFSCFSQLAAIGMGMVMVSASQPSTPTQLTTVLRLSSLLQRTYQHDPHHLSGVVRRILYQFVGPN